MSLPTAFTLQCSPVELAALASVAGASWLVGLPDPFAELTAEELDGRVAEALRRLQEDGHCARDGAGRWRLAPRLNLLVESLVRATSCLCIGVSGAREVFMAYYGGGPRLLRVDVHPERGCLATMDPDPPEQALLDLLEFPQSPPRDGRPFELPPGALGPLRSLGSREWIAEELVRMTGRPVAAALAGTLLAPRRAGVVTVLRRFSEGGWIGEGINFLEGGHDLWRLRPVRHGQDEWTEVRPMGGAALMEDLSALARQFTPVLGARG